MKKSLHGWNITKDYKSNVLINNWFEERLNYDKENFKHNTTYRTNYSSTSLPFPDVIMRRKNWLRGDGIGTPFMLRHHGHVYDDSLITLYDQEINHRERKGRNALPPLRKWDSTTISWIPEKSDFPIYGEPTNWGLHDEKKRRWDNQRNEMSKPDNLSLSTTYSDSFHSPSIDAYSRLRFSKPLKAN